MAISSQNGFFFVILFLWNVKSTNYVLSKDILFSMKNVTTNSNETCEFHADAVNDIMNSFRKNGTRLGYLQVHLNETISGNITQNMINPFEWIWISGGYGSNMLLFQDTYPLILIHIIKPGIQNQNIEVSADPSGCALHLSPRDFQSKITTALIKGTNNDLITESVCFLDFSSDIYFNCSYIQRQKIITYRLTADKPFFFLHVFFVFMQICVFLIILNVLVELFSEKALNEEIEIGKIEGIEVESDLRGEEYLPIGEILTINRHLFIEEKFSISYNSSWMMYHFKDKLKIHKWVVVRIVIVMIYILLGIRILIYFTIKDPFLKVRENFATKHGLKTHYNIWALIYVICHILFLIFLSMSCIIFKALDLTQSLTDEYNEILKHRKELEDTFIAVRTLYICKKAVELYCDQTERKLQKCPIIITLFLFFVSMTFLILEIFTFLISNLTYLAITIIITLSVELVIMVSIIAAISYIVFLINKDFETYDLHHVTLKKYIRNSLMTREYPDGQTLIFLVTRDSCSISVENEKMTLKGVVPIFVNECDVFCLPRIFFIRTMKMMKCKNSPGPFGSCILKTVIKLLLTVGFLIYVSLIILSFDGVSLASRLFALLSSSVVPRLLMSSKTHDGFDIKDYDFKKSFRKAVKDYEDEWQIDQKIKTTQSHDDLVFSVLDSRFHFTA